MTDKTVKHIDIPDFAQTKYKWVSEELHDLADDTILVASKPPEGCKKIINIWRDADGNISYEYEE